MLDITPYLDQIKTFTQSKKGALILCVSDTETSQYPALGALLAEVRPNHIIHTGDCADEFKVGRLEADRPGYEAGMKTLMELLHGAACPLLFTSGNNDDLNLIAGQKNVTIVPNHTVVDLFGLKFLLDHYPITDAGAVDFALSGHTGKSDFHYPPADTAGEAIYLNGMFHWTLIDAETKEFLRIPCRTPLFISEYTDEATPGIRYRKSSAGTVHQFPPKKKWYLTQMHLHAGHENFSSIRSHAAEAKRLGYNAIFITEHDLRMNRPVGCIEHFHLTAPGDALREDGKAGWYLDEETPARSVAHETGFSLQLLPGESAFFASAGKKHQASLFSDFSVTLQLAFDQNTSVLVDFTLSQRPEDLCQQHLVYGCNTEPQKEWYKTFSWSENGTYTFPLSRDALEFDPLYGLDNAFLTVTITAIDGEVLVRELHTARQYIGEEVRKRQKTMGKTLAREMKLAIHSGFELTLGHHRNCFSAHVPVINYEETGYTTNEKNGAAYLRSKDATFAYNHMFQEFKNAPEEEHEAAIQAVIERGLRTQFDGAQLLEVGFPQKKLGFSLEEHLRVWDALGTQGVRLVGYGDSDSHNSKSGWEHGNCFGTWILAESSTQEALERSLRAGKVCFGNPNRWRANWDFSIDSAAIGETLSTDTATAVIRFWNLKTPCELRVISAGKILHRLAMDRETFDCRLPLSRDGLDCCPVRLEVWSPEERPLFFTNPIYLTAIED